jgi:hypothetical protein
LLDLASADGPGSGFEGCYLVHGHAERVGDLLLSDSAAAAFSRGDTADGGCLPWVGRDVCGRTGTQVGLCQTPSRPLQSHGLTLLPAMDARGAKQDKTARGLAREQIL